MSSRTPAACVCWESEAAGRPVVKEAIDGTWGIYVLGKVSKCCEMGVAEFMDRFFPEHATLDF